LFLFPTHDERLIEAAIVADAELGELVAEFGEEGSAVGLAFIATEEKEVVEDFVVGGFEGAVAFDPGIDGAGNKVGGAVRGGEAF